MILSADILLSKVAGRVPQSSTLSIYLSPSGIRRSAMDLENTAMLPPLGQLPDRRGIHSIPAALGPRAKETFLILCRSRRLKLLSPSPSRSTRRRDRRFRWGLCESLSHVIGKGYCVTQSRRNRFG